MKIVFVMESDRGLSVVLPIYNTDLLGNVCKVQIVRTRLVDTPFLLFGASVVYGYRSDLSASRKSIRNDSRILPC